MTVYRKPTAGPMASFDLTKTEVMEIFGPAAGMPILVEHDHRDIASWRQDYSLREGAFYACLHCGEFSKDLPPHRFVVSDQWPPFCDCGRLADEASHVADRTGA